jgi:hypothetical protein
MAHNISTKLHFPARLYQLIEIEDPSIIAWEIDGRSFRIVDSKRFRAETVPKYFRRKCKSLNLMVNRLIHMLSTQMEIWPPFSASLICMDFDAPTVSMRRGYSAIPTSFGVSTTKFEIFAERRLGPRSESRRPMLALRLPSPVRHLVAKRLLHVMRPKLAWFRLADLISTSVACPSAVKTFLRWQIVPHPCRTFSSQNTPTFWISLMINLLMK